MLTCMHARPFYGSHESNFVCRPRKKQGFLSGITQALDFSAARSKEDEELLYQAKNAKAGKLSDEQVQ